MQSIVLRTFNESGPFIGIRRGRRGEERQEPISLPWQESDFGTVNFPGDAHSYQADGAWHISRDVSNFFAIFDSIVTLLNCILARGKSQSQDLILSHFYSLQNSIPKDFLNRLSYINNI